MPGWPYAPVDAQCSGDGCDAEKCANGGEHACVEPVAGVGPWVDWRQWRRLSSHGYAGRRVEPMKSKPGQFPLSRETRGGLKDGEESLKSKLATD